MALKSIDKIISDIEGTKEDIPYEEKHQIREYLLVGYDVEGRNYSEDILLKYRTNGHGEQVSEFEDAKQRITGQLQREVDAGRMTPEEAFGTENRFGQLVGGHLQRKMSNSTRNWLRDKILNEFGGIYMADSMYLIPILVMRDSNGNKMDVSGAQEFLEAWGRRKGVDIKTMANTIATERDVENVSKAYYKVLRDRFTEMDEKLKTAHNKLMDLANEVEADPKKTIRGVHRIVEAIEANTEEAQALVSRYGEPEKDQFHLYQIIQTTKGIRETFERVKAMKESAK